MTTPKPTRTPTRKDLPGVARRARIRQDIRDACIRHGFTLDDNHLLEIDHHGDASKNTLVLLLGPSYIEGWKQIRKVEPARGYDLDELATILRGVQARFDAWREAERKARSARAAAQVAESAFDTTYNGCGLLFSTASYDDGTLRLTLRELPSARLLHLATCLSTALREGVVAVEITQIGPEQLLALGQALFEAGLLVQLPPEKEGTQNEAESQGA